MKPNEVKFDGPAKLEFSYGQFLVFDDAERQPGCDWQTAHVAQGFARRASAVGFTTLLEFGIATLRVYVGKYIRDDLHERVIAVPFQTKSGGVRIEGPDEHPVARRVPLASGHYRVYAAQGILVEDEENMIMEEAIDLFFEPMSSPAEKSEIIVADAELNPPDELLEDADPIEL